MKKYEVPESEVKKISDVIGMAITARHLREALESVHDDTAILFVCDYGDYHNTQQVLPVGDFLMDSSASDLYTSGYSNSGVALIEDDSNDEPREYPEEENYPILLLR